MSGTVRHVRGVMLQEFNYIVSVYVGPECLEKHVGNRCSSEDQVHITYPSLHSNTSHTHTHTHIMVCR